MTASKTDSDGDDQSMYMSAISAAPHQQGHVPGGWDSSSSASSHGASSEVSGDVPEEMIAGSILQPQPNVDEGCETPRPMSPQSGFSSPQQTRHVPVIPAESLDRTQGSSSRLFAKVFLTIDEVTVWFPLGLDPQATSEPVAEAADIDFNPSGIAEDSIFETMPGTFSYHAASSRKKPATGDATRRRSVYQTMPPREPLNASVEVGTVLFHMDLVTGQTMIQMLMRAATALGGNIDEPAKGPTKAENAPTTDSRFSADLSIKYVCIAWRELLLTESFTEGCISCNLLDQESPDAIVKIAMTSVFSAYQKTTTETKSKLQIGKFMLSSMDEEIIAFESSPKARKLSHASEALKHDLELTYEQKQDRRLTLVTRPVKVHFDLEFVWRLQRRVRDECLTKLE